MKRVFWISLLIVEIALLAYMLGQPGILRPGKQNNSINQDAITCSSGSYDAGGFCKAEPTGCPYGDSIPVDSPKCVAPVDPIDTQLQPMVGK